MSSAPKLLSSPTRQPEIIQAKSGSLTEAIADVFSSLPSRFRIRPDSALLSSDPHQKLSSMISQITINDVQAAKRCGGGGFGKVLVVEHPTKGKVSGIQGCDDLRRRTLREGDTWKDLNHPGVLPFLGILETPTDLYLISPYVENGSLDEYLRRHPNADRRAFLLQAAGAIAYLHACGIVHGDIKASNILVSDNIHALVCDFGLAKSEAAVTSRGLEGAGTIRFQSPELLIRGRGKTLASDAWAFGMTIYEVLSGNIPFPDYNTASMINAVANRDERPPKSPDYSPSGLSYHSLWTVADDCWEKDPTRRLSMEDAHKRLSPRSMVLHAPKALKVHTEKISCFAYSPDGGTIVLGSRDCTLRLWDVESGLQQGEGFTGHTRWITSVAFSPDGRTIVSGSDDFTVRLWNTDTESSCQQGEALTGHTYMVRCVAFSPDGITVVSGSADTTIRLWDVASGRQRGEALRGHTGWIRCIAVSPDGKTVVSGSEGHTIRLWNMESASQFGMEWNGGSSWANCVTFSPDGRTIVSGLSHGIVQVLGVESGIQSSRGIALKGHTRAVQCVAFSPDGGAIVSGSDDRSLRLWDTGSGLQRGKTLEAHLHSVRCVAFSPDGMTIASGSGYYTLRLWHVV